MLAVIFLVTAVSVGITLAALLPTVLSLEERVAMGIPLGLAIGGLVTFAVSLLFGLGPWTVGGVTIALGLATFTGATYGTARKRLAGELNELMRQARSREFFLTFGVFGAVVALLWLVLWHAVFLHEGTLYAGFSNVWGDWSLHLSQTASFAYRDNLPPELPTMSGHRLSYPFMANFLSAILVVGGLPFLTAMKVPALLLATASVWLLLAFGRYLAGGKASVLVPVLFVFSGGLGFVNFFNDLATNDSSLGYFFSHLPRSYTSAPGDEALISNLHWINSVYAFVVPQRAFLFGLPLVLTVLILLYLGIERRSRWLFLAAGLVASLLPLIHTHGLVFLGFITPPLVLLTLRVKQWDRQGLTNWLYFVVPIALIGLPQFLWLTAGVDTEKFTRLQPGWLAKEDNVAWFWLKNIGLFLPLLAAAIAVLLRSRNRLLLSFTLAVGLVFIVANLLVFQPWDWDNTKLFLYWYVASLPAVAWVLVWLAATKGLASKIGVAVLVIVLCLAGALDVSKTLQWQAHKLVMLDQTGLEIGIVTRQETPPDSTFLTSQIFNNPFTIYAGRQIVLGYTGWLSSYGIDYEQRQRDVAAMYEAKPGTETLFREYGVDYVVIGPSEQTSPDYRVNELFYRDRYEIWRQFGPVTVYDVSRPKPLASP